MDLISSELSRKFDQQGMTITALREKTALRAANGETSPVTLQALHLPPLFDPARLQLQLQMLRDVVNGGKCRKKFFDSQTPQNLAEE